MVWLSVYGISRSESASAGPIARSGATSRSPSAALPVYATRTETTYRPRSGSGSRGESGYWSAASEDVTVSGRVPAHSR